MAYIGSNGGDGQRQAESSPSDDGASRKKKGVSALSLFVTFLCYVVYGIILAKNPTGGLGAKILAMVIFLITAPIGVWIGGAIGNLICPQIIITSGAGALLKERLFWWVGPRFIGAGIAALGATVLAVPEIL